MARLENWYLELGVARTATEMEIAQAYRAGVQKIQTAPDASPDQTEHRLQKLEAAYQSLLVPEKRKKHDETLAWHDARQRLDREREMRLAQALKEEQEAAVEAARLATLRAAEAASLAAAEAKRKEEEARVYAEADARLRQLREERSGFSETLPQVEPPAPSVQAGQDTGLVSTDAKPPTRSVGAATIIGSVLVVGVLFVALLSLRPGASKPAPAPVPAQAQASAPLPQAPVAAQAAMPASTTSAAQTASNPDAPPAQVTTPNAIKVAKPDSGKVLEAQNYQKAVKHMETEHPELNAHHASYRADRMAFVNSRMQAHVRAGYPKSKALEIAVRDLETQDHIHQAIEKQRGQKVQALPETPAVVDKGGHSGFDPKCRWVNSQEWSCK